ncbi:MoaD/ThiS family protein [Candidatus Woesearchaeota archaeon]|nr:MoaD/ThiS family protein [Candidatus Woesearchaeota archaeon]
MPNVNIFIERENIKKRLNAKSIEDIMKKFKINPEVVLIAKNNELVTKNAKIKENDDIKFISVISGG